MSINKTEHPAAFCLFIRSFPSSPTSTLHWRCLWWSTGRSVTLLWLGPTSSRTSWTMLYVSREERKKMKKNQNQKVTAFKVVKAGKKSTWTWIFNIYLDVCIISKWTINYVNCFKSYQISAVYLGGKQINLQCINLYSCSMLLKFHFVHCSNDTSVLNVCLF